MGRLVFYTNGTQEQSAYCFGNLIANKMDMPIDIPVSELRPDDVLIMVKCAFMNMQWVLSRVKKVYFVIGDGWRPIHRFITPDISLIMLTPRAAEIYQEYYPKNEVIWIPLAHSNPENLVRPLGGPVKKIIYHGTRSGFPDGPWEEFKLKAESNGFETTRIVLVGGNQGAIGDEYRRYCRDVWLNSDIAVSFRKPLHTNKGHVELRLKPPNKLNGAGSVQVPSAAYPEEGFVTNYDKPSSFLPSTTIDEMVDNCCKLRDDKELYARIASQALRDAQRYHIDKVIPYYWKLLNEN